MQKAFEVRSIHTTLNGDKFAVAEYESKVQIWDINTGFVNELETNQKYGLPETISISQDGRHICVGGHDNKSVTLYDVLSGEILWQRNDIRRPSTVIILDQNKDLIFVRTERQGSLFLDKRNGETIYKPRGIEFIREHPLRSIDQFEKDSSSTLIDRVSKKSIINIKHKSFALLDSTFSQDIFFCSYSGNPLEAISLIDYKTIWSIEVVGHFLEIEYCKECNTLLGIRWDYNNGGPCYLTSMNGQTGEVMEEMKLNETGMIVKFLKTGRFILSSNGDMYSTTTKTLIQKFNFNRL